MNILRRRLLHLQRKMLTSGSKTLQRGDYLVIVAYFLFVLAVGLWVGPGHYTLGDSLT